MDNITLAKAKEIAKAINKYGETHADLDFTQLSTYLLKYVKTDVEEISKVVQFLQEIQGASETIPIHDPEQISMNERVTNFTSQPLNLATEIQYNYAVARALLQVILERGTNPDSEEVRKTLREISRFSDAMLKMQERVYNIQEMQTFQEKVIQLIEDNGSVELNRLLLEADL